MIDVSRRLDAVHRQHGALRWIVLMAATAVVVLITAIPAAAQDVCDIPPHPSWTEPEATVWRQLCVGELADFNPEGEPLDPNQPDGWDDRRVVSSPFIERLLTEPYVSVIDRHGIRLSGAWFRDILNVSESTMGFSLRCQYCRLAGLNAYGAVVDGALDLSGSAIEGDVNVVHARIQSDLTLDDGSVISGKLDATGATVGGYVFLNGSRFNNVDLRSAEIGLNLEARDGSVISGDLNASGATVGGGVFLYGSTFKEVSLGGADIEGLIALAFMKWSSDGILDLTSAHANRIWTDGSGGQLGAKDRAGPLWVRGMGPPGSRCARGWAGWRLVLGVKATRA